MRKKALSQNRTKKSTTKRAGKDTKESAPISEYSRKDGDINTSMSEILIDIIDHTLEVFDSSASRNDEDYCERLEGEIDLQHFPNFPLRRERAFYEKTCNVEDEKSLKFMWEKDFPSHSTLTPAF